MNTRASLAALALATLTSACVKGQPATIEIYQACYPPTPAEGGVCSYPTGSCSLTILGTYGIDAAVASHYFVGVEVHNLLEDNGGSDLGGNNTHNAYVDSYSVSYSGVSGVGDTTGNISNTVPARGSAVVGVLLADSAAIAALGSRIPASGVLHVTAHLKLKGKWGDQSSFETAAHSFGIDVCNGCWAPPTCDAGKELFLCPGAGVFPSAYSCGGSGGGKTFTVGGAVTGLTNGTLVVNCTGLSPVTVSGSGSFTFAGSVPDGTNYTCTIDTTASTTTNSCSFGGGTDKGTVNGANVTTLQISCT